MRGTVFFLQPWDIKKFLGSRIYLYVVQSGETFFEKVGNFTNKGRKERPVDNFDRFLKDKIDHWRDLPFESFSLPES